VDNVIEESGSKIKDFGNINAPRQNSGEVQEVFLKLVIDSKYKVVNILDNLSDDINKHNDYTEIIEMEKKETLRNDRGFKK
jgi:hypothetical protein